jgi:2-polyprenyl-6-methoxyphenol hydroxylase-like FAD-dependent oxidoreductase
VQVSFAKEASRNFDLIIIADGQNSKTRELVFENSTSPIHRLGHVATLHLKEDVSCYDLIAKEPPQLVHF